MLAHATQGEHIVVSPVDEGARALTAAEAAEPVVPAADPPLDHAGHDYRDPYRVPDVARRAAAARSIR
jgi:hypothetical protein